MVQDALLSNATLANMELWERPFLTFWEGDYSCLMSQQSIEQCWRQRLLVFCTWDDGFGKGVFAFSRGSMQVVCVCAHIKPSSWPPTLWNALFVVLLTPRARPSKHYCPSLETPVALYQDTGRVPLIMVRSMARTHWKIPNSIWHRLLKESCLHPYHWRSAAWFPLQLDVWVSANYHISHQSWSWCWTTMFPFSRTNGYSLVVETEIN